MTNPTERVLRLLGLLESRPYWLGEELAELLGVSTRTVRRDVDRLRTLGYSVDAEAGLGGGYSLGRGALVPPLLLDEAEALAVTLGLTAATAAGLAPDAESSLRALRKVERTLPSSVRHKVETLRSRVEAVGGVSPVHPAVMSAVAESTRTNVRLRFGYVDRRGIETERLVEPHHVLFRYHHWHVVGFDVDRDDWRTFRLDRVRDPELTSWEFRARSDAAAAIERARQGMPLSAYRLQFVLRCRSPLEDVLREIPAGAGDFVVVDELHTDVFTGADSPRDAARWLLAVRLPFELQGPVELRDAMAELAKNARRLAANFDVG